MTRNMLKSRVFDLEHTLNQLTEGHAQSLRQKRSGIIICRKKGERKKIESGEAAFLESSWPLFLCLWLQSLLLGKRYTETSLDVCKSIFNWCFLTVSSHPIGLWMLPSTMGFFEVPPINYCSNKIHGLVFIHVGHNTGPDVAEMGWCVLNVNVWSP